MFVAEKNIISQSECLVTCGSGHRLQKYFTCQAKIINGQKTQECDDTNEVGEELVPCNNAECQTNSGTWSLWSKCSSDCLETLDEISTQTRGKGCQNNRTSNCLATETRSCSVPMCSPESGKYFSTFNIVFITKLISFVLTHYLRILSNLEDC